MPVGSDVAGARNAILGVAIAAIAANAFAEGGYGFWDAIVGILLFLVLVEFWRIELPSLTLRWAYSLSFSYVLIMMFGLVFDLNFPFLSTAGEFPRSLLDRIIGSDPTGFYRGATVFSTWLTLGAVIHVVRRLSCSR